MQIYLVLVMTTLKIIRPTSMTDADRLAMIWIFDSPYILVDGLVVCVVNEHEVSLVTV